MSPSWHSVPRYACYLQNRPIGQFPTTNIFLKSRRFVSPSSHPPFPTIPTCPDPTCECTATPSMPDGLAIDHKRPLNATMAPYTQQILIATGQTDWSSRIEEDGVGKSWGSLVRNLKTMFGRGGKYADPYNNLVITNSSFTPQSQTSSRFASALLFPAFKYIPHIPVETADTGNDQPTLDSFARSYVLPLELHPAHAGLPNVQRQQLTGSPERAFALFPDAVDIRQSPTILICGHGGRDMRCGTMRPVLQAEFARVLRRKGFSISGDVGGGGSAENNFLDEPCHVNIASISHIGGHKYAGNVIIYIPPAFMPMASPAWQSTSSLAGKGIWYGRVEPKHVEGLVEETFFRGRVIEDHFRGGIGRQGEIYRL